MQFDKDLPQQTIQICKIITIKRNAKLGVNFFSNILNFKTFNQNHEKESTPTCQQNNCTTKSIIQYPG